MSLTPNSARSRTQGEDPYNDSRICYKALHDYARENFKVTSFVLRYSCSASVHAHPVPSRALLVHYWLFSC